MIDPDSIRRLFTSVLQEDIQKHNLSHGDIRTGIQNMKEVYKPNPSSLSSEFLDVANYNDTAHRCAYLHKYAPLHTALVSEVMKHSIPHIKFILHDILSNTVKFEICSLGGGPGSDVLGVIFVLIEELGFFQISATIIDCMVNWKYTFAAVVSELRQRNYGLISDFIQPQYFNWNYIGHNLLGKMSNDVNKTIQGANLITMVKFVSAAACKDTAEMVKKIFRSLKPGALVLFIDNAAGNFYELVVKGAQESSMVTVFGPLRHEKYTNMAFNVQRFGYTPCLETKVTIHMWMKPNYNKPNLLSALANRPRLQSLTVNNTFNQYNITNTNIYVSSTNNLNLPSNTSVNDNFQQPNFEYRNSAQSSIQKQPQLQIKAPQAEYIPKVQKYIDNQNSIDSRYPPQNSSQRQSQYHKIPEQRYINNQRSIDSRYSPQNYSQRQPQYHNVTNSSDNEYNNSYGRTNDDSDNCGCCVIL